MKYLHIFGIGIVIMLVYYIALDIYIQTKVKNEIIEEFTKDINEEPENVQKVIKEVLLRIGKK
jgi:predicted DNA-binding protein YlxM (UPF0122 family)